MNIADIPGAPFDVVFDVGGNIGEFAERAVRAWPEASVVSFEPLPGAAHANRERAAGRWVVYETAIGEHPDRLPLHFCLNQHTASTMQEPGTVRRQRFGIVDRYETIEVDVSPLDRYLSFTERGRHEERRLLVKVDVEGHELRVLRGARRVLDRATTVVCEVQQDPAIFLGSPSPARVDLEMRGHGLRFAGLAGALLAPGAVLQFDGVWTRDAAALRESMRQL